MPRVFFGDAEEGQAAMGATLYNGVMKMFAVRRDNPLDMVYLSGHRIEDALTYNLTDAAIVPEYVDEDGENTVLDVYLSDDSVKSINLNLALPNKSITAAQRILQTQKNCVWDLLLVPENCPEGCEAVYWLGRNLRLSANQITGVPTGYDSTKGALTRIMVARITGQLLQYNGLITKTLTAAAVPLNDVLISNAKCEGCTCPYQTLYRAGTGATIEESLDGGATWTALITAAITVGTIVTSLAEVSGNVLAGHSDVNNGAGTEGGVAFNSNGTFVEASFTTALGASVTPDIQAVVPVGGSVVYALGSLAGVASIWKSCNAGTSFDEIVQSTITAPILTATWDKAGILWIGTEGNGGVYAYDLSIFTDETANVGAGAVDTISIEVTAKNSVGVGFSNGTFYENFTYNKDGSWRDSATRTNPVLASNGDNYNYRTLLASGTDLEIRDGNNDQIFENILTATGNITAIREGKPLLEEETNFFIAVSDVGETFLITQCGICLDSGC